MKKFSKELLRGYQNGYQMKLWKGLAIYPKILQEKPLSQFSKEEKEELTRKGLRWRVYFSFYNPDAGKGGAFEKHVVPTYGINKESNFDDRYRSIHRLLKATKEMLQDGHSPLDVTIEDGEVVTIGKAIDFALDNKKLKVSPDTYKNYEIRVRQLKAYLKKKGQLERGAATFNYKIIRDFLKEIATKTSMANRNNALSVIKALWAEMYKNDLIPENHVAKIEKEKVNTKRFLSYSQEEAEHLMKHLEETDPVMSLYVKFIGYNFLRIKEAARLRVKDLNLKEKTLQVFVKQGKFKTKRIPDDIIQSLSNFDLSNKEALLFGLNKVGEEWDRDLKGRAEYYSKRYTSIIRPMGYGKGYTLYSNRHTYVTIGYRNLRKRLSKDEALDTLMGYTGHDTREALLKYIHYIDADIVAEYKGIVK